MHKSVMSFVADHVTRLGIAGHSVLEVGSYNVNGTVRPCFTGPYVGVDLRDGPGVDRVVLPGILPFDKYQFDVVVCTEVLEHDDRPWQTMHAMAYVLKVGGIMIVTARGYDKSGCFPIHDYPQDLWRFSPGSIDRLMRYASVEPLVCDYDPEAPGVLAVGVRSTWDQANPNGGTR